MGWIYLVIAGFLEIGFTTFLKLTENFTKTLPTIIFFAFSIASFWFLNRALATIPLGIAYAVWTGIGAAGTAMMGIYLFNDQLSAWTIFFIGTLIASIIGLKVLA